MHNSDLSVKIEIAEKESVKVEFVLSQTWLLKATEANSLRFQMSIQASIRKNAPDYLLPGVVCVTLDIRPAFIIVGALSLRHFSLLPVLPCGFVCPCKVR